MTLQSLARTIAKAHGDTDADWLEYMGAAEAVMRELEIAAADDLDWEARNWIRLIAQPDGAQ
ncbi:hypothetical protein [Mesorhizobium sp. M0146]|uniref:hypothetical protein n=1 Tax=unclassified Mesorhizobium TaxID=325217 RepID=UPI00333B96A7